jgi:hypothetical protein
MWKPVPRWENRYEVSSEGAIRSLDMAVKAGRPPYGTAIRKGRVLTPIVKGGRYLCVTLAQGSRREQHLVHDVVASAFIGPKPKGMETRHLNDNKYENTAANLAYGTRQENEADRQRNDKVPRGERSGVAKLTTAQVLEIRYSEKGPKALGIKFGVTAAHIHAVRTRRVWKHLKD